MRLWPAFAVVLIASCDRNATPVERGASTFRKTCAGCHGMDARGTHPPGFKTPPRNLTDPELQTRLSDAAIKETIVYGKGQMPNFGALLSDQQIDDLVRYIRSLRKL
jgi:mono/diheme cytochrome c family protein